MPSYAKKVVIEYPAAPVYLNSDGTQYSSNGVNYPKVNELEKLILNANFSDQPLDIRLARLEQRIFGASQRGDFNYRVEKLMDASKILANNQTAYSAQEENSGTKAKKGLSNLAKLLTGGQLTGYTPPVYMDPYYAQPYYSNTQQPYSANYPTYNNNNFNTSNFGNLPYVPKYSNGGFGNTGGRFNDLFSSGSGNEFYYDDGRFQRDLRSTGGGAGVKIIY